MSGEVDPAGPDKDRLEADMMGDLVRYWQGQRIRIQEALQKKIPKDRKTINLSDSFWTNEEQELLRYLLPAIQQGAEGGVTVHKDIVENLGIGVDWTLPYTEAADWARKYGGKLVGGITRTTKDRIGVLTGNWIETPGAPLEQLWTQLMNDHAFSPSRAKLIAITEVTSAYARGEMTAARQLEKEGYFEYQKVWQTNNDDIVCGLCEPLQGETVQGVKTNFSIGVKGPPAHPGCRCWHNLIPAVPVVEEGIAETVTPPRFTSHQEAEQWIIDNLMSSTLGRDILDIDISGIPMEVIEEFAGEYHRVTRQYDLPGMITLRAETRNPMALASSGPAGWAINRDLISDIAQRGYRLDEYISLLNDDGQISSRSIRDVAAHEAHHRVQTYAYTDQMEKTAIDAYSMELLAGRASRISRYAETNHREFDSEAYVIWRRGGEEALRNTGISHTAINLLLEIFR